VECGGRCSVESLSAKIAPNGWGLKDVLLVPEGRSSIDAIILFGALLAAGSCGFPLFQLKTERAKPRA